MGKIRKFLHFVFLVCCLGLLNACTEYTGKGGDEEELPLPYEVSRTVLVYIMADNSLSSSANINLKQIKNGAKGSLCNGNLLVYVDQLREKPVLYKISNKGEAVQVKQYTEQNSASCDVFSKVLDDVFGRYPAEEKGVIMWSHGEGWRYRRPEGIPVKSIAETPQVGDYILTKWVGQDYETEEGGTYYFNIPDLKKALSDKGIQLDFMIHDACFMSSVEVAYELRHQVKNYIASPAEIVGTNTYYPDHTGFPYTQLMHELFAETVNYRKITMDFYDYYNSLAIYGGGSDHIRSAAIAWVDTQELDSLVVLTDSLMQKATFPQKYLNVSDVQTYDRSSTRSYHLYYDLEHVMSRIATEDVEALNRWRAQLGRCVKAKFHTSKVFGHDLFSVCGLSVYVPQRSSQLYEDGYADLEWYQKSGWHLLPGWYKTSIQ